MKYKPRLGQDFPVEAVVIKEKASYLKEGTRSVIAVAVVGIAAVALLVGAMVWAFGGGSDALESVWNFVALPVGLILGHYFSPRQTENGNRDKA
jgi:hypothetical protein